MPGIRVRAFAKPDAWFMGWRYYLMLSANVPSGVSRPWIFLTKCS